MENEEKYEEGKVFTLPIYGIIVVVHDDGGGSIDSDLSEPCPCCGSFLCYGDCEDCTESEDDQTQRFIQNVKVEALESMIVAQACAGIDITTPAYLESIETVVDRITNSF